ncbi:MAG: HD domain-containing phosphohydrolase, partial [Thermoanaerobaculia bacterium]|nr:HD domain-containing phosphohydrolase [Thermoanaerobaculia bacterium]
VPEGMNGPPVTASRLNTILSAPVDIENLSGLVLSVGFESQPDRETQQKLTAYLDQIKQTIIHSISHHSLSSTRQRAAERLLEPDFEQYPDLADHSQRVSDLAERFAKHLDLSGQEIETIRIAAYVHDVGMRLLDYEELYSKTELSGEEMALIRRHPEVSAALVARSALGPDIAEIVLYHHERPDGNGYPKGLTGTQIPKASRILGLCEAFIAMTAPNGYQPAMPESSAIHQIRQSAGSQFDRELALKFVEMLEEPL